MKVITPTEAQELADILQMVLTQDSFETVELWHSDDGMFIAKNFWAGNDFCSKLENIRISSDLPWTKQIWRPQPQKEDR